MGFIGDLFSSDKGAGYQAAGAGYGTAGNRPMTAPVENWVGNNTLNAQQGIVNSAMGRSEGALGQQGAFVNALGAGANQGMGAQQQLMRQLQQQSQGGGPNPAQNMLNQATGKNVSQQGALMASQRGSGANAGLLARQAGMQGADIQQQAAGQAATLGSQQQLAAQQQLQQLAGQTVGQQGGALQNYNQMAQGYQGLTQQQQQAFLNAQAQANAGNVAMQSNINSANAGIANTNAQGQQGIFGGILSGIGGIFGLAEGGMVPGYQEGGSVESSDGGPISGPGRFLTGAPINPAPPMGGASAQAAGTGQNAGAQAMAQGAKDLFGGPAAKLKGMMGGGGGGGLGGLMGGGGGEAAAGGASVADLAPLLLAANKGGRVPKKMSPGGKVHGQAKVKGDDLRNDTVSAMLSPGEIVIPRTVVQSKDPVSASARFVQAILAKENMKRRA